MKVFLKGKEYKGLAAYIDGFNGYDSANGDGSLCALLPTKRHPKQLSCWDDERIPNLLTTEKGEIIVNRNLRGVCINIE